MSVSWEELGDRAWGVRDNARILGKTTAGAAALSETGRIHVGCNVEHKFRAHDIHAEVNALSSMTAAGDGPVIAILIAAYRDRFTPCGGCMDWIFELGGPECLVAFQGNPGGLPDILRADALMPHYPC